MYAIVKNGGKQYRVEAGNTIHVERLAAAVGDKVTLGDVLLVGGDGETRLGLPPVAKRRGPGDGRRAGP